MPGPGPPHPTVPHSSTTRVGRNPFRHQEAQPLAPAMFAELPLPNPPTPVLRTGTYGLAMPPMQGAAQRMLHPTSNTPWAPGTLTTPPSTYEYGTNPWPLLMYPASQPLILTFPRPSISMTPTASHYRPTNDPNAAELTLGWLYPIPTTLIGPSSEGAHSYNTPKDDSHLNLMPLTPTLRFPDTSPTRHSNSPVLADLIHFAMITTPDPELSETHSTPMSLTMNGPNSPPTTGRYSAPREPLSGISGGRILNEGLSTETEGSENPWTSSLPPLGETQLRRQEASRPSWPGSTPTNTASYMDQLRGPMYETYAPGPTRSRESWRRPYNHGQKGRMISSKGPISEGFHYDEETFGEGYVNNEEEFISIDSHLLWGMDNSLPPFPQPLPDSPPQCQNVWQIAVPTTTWKLTRSRSRRREHGCRRIGGGPSTHYQAMPTAGAGSDCADV